MQPKPKFIPENSEDFEYVKNQFKEGLIQNNIRKLREKGEMTVAEVTDHPIFEMEELKSLGEIPVVITNDLPENVGGQYSKSVENGRKILLNANQSVASMDRTLTHELQHAIDQAYKTWADHIANPTNPFDNDGHDAMGMEQTTETNDILIHLERMKSRGWDDEKISEYLDKRIKFFSKVNTAVSIAKRQQYQMARKLFFRNNK